MKEMTARQKLIYDLCQDMSDGKDPMISVKPIFVRVGEILNLDRRIVRKEYAQAARLLRREQYANKKDV